MSGLDITTQPAPDKAAVTASSTSTYVPLDIDDPNGRFGSWMPGDDEDDWR
jgi:hypothetical protein